MVAAYLLLLGCDGQSNHNQTTSVPEAAMPVTVTRIQPPSELEASEERSVFRIGSGLNLQGTAASNDAQQWLDYVFAEIGKEVRFEYIPGRRMMIELNTGEVDVDLARAIDISRGFDNIERIDHPWMNACSIVVGLAKNKKAYRRPLTVGEDVDLIADAPVVGIFSGSPAMAASAERSFPGYIVVEYKSDRQAVLLLQHGRVDAIITSHLNWEHLRDMAERPLDVYDVLGEAPIYMHIHKKHLPKIPHIITGLKKYADKIAHLSCDIDQLRANYQLPPASSLR